VLRRVPDRLLIRDPADPDVAHLMQLARERDVTVAPLGGNHGYRAVAVIRSVSSD
jgi:FAD/FMN-containing dehydrogenase